LRYIINHKHNQDYGRPGSAFQLLNECFEVTES
jgi:hypothetical protein